MSELSVIKRANKELPKIIENSSEIYIVGHKTADFDSIGAALGLTRLCREYIDGSKIFIVLNDSDESLEPGLKRVKYDSKEEYNIIGLEEFNNRKRTSSPTLLVVDTNRKHLIDLNANLPEFKNVVVIDHHKPTQDSIETEYSFIDTTASSACEMIAGLLNLNKIGYDSNIATYLLAGIMLDTKRYIKNTTPKTMDTAEKLLAKGADYNKINDLFLVDFEQDRKINDLIFSNTVFETYDYGVPRSISYTFNIYNDKAIYRREELGRAADKMLKYRVDAIFVFGQIDENTISISARSKSNVDVGTIMEQLGGGGNLQNAGCQIQGKSIMEIYALLRETVKTDLQFQNIIEEKPTTANFQYIKKMPQKD